MADMNIEEARNNMIEQQIRPWDVLDQRILNLSRQIPREQFVAEEYRNIAFTDTALPIGFGEVMMEPKLEARMLQSLALKSDDAALEIGTGSGYVTALLATLAGSVTSVEINDKLLEQARQRLHTLESTNVTLEHGDAAGGWGDSQSWDAIAVTGSLTSLPEGALETLRTGGRLFAVIGTEPPMQALLMTRLNATEWHREILFETMLPPLQQHGLRPQFVF